MLWFLPTLTTMNVRYGGHGDSITYCNLAARHLSPQRSDFTHLLRCQLRHRTALYVRGVLDWLNVIGATARSLSAEMIQLKTVRDRSVLVYVVRNVCHQRPMQFASEDSISIG